MSRPNPALSVTPLPLSLSVSKDFLPRRKEKKKKKKKNKKDRASVVEEATYLTRIKKKKNNKSDNKMMLGKRPRPPLARTTSMSEITFDLNPENEEALPSAENPYLISQNDVRFSGNHPDQWLSAAATAMVSPRCHRRASADFSETAHFLRSCFLCNRRLVPGRDIYMYRGDSAFCSLECRQQQMNQDERKEKCSMASKKEATSSATVPEVPTKGETVVAL